MAEIHTALIEVKRAIRAISKDQVNQMQRFNFRGIDQVYNSMHGLLAAAGVVTLPEVLEQIREERPAKNGGTLNFTVLRVAYHFFAADGSSVRAVVAGEAMDSGDKATNKALSAAHKYALLQTFMVPTEDVTDGDQDSPEPAGRASEDQLATLLDLARGHAGREKWLKKFTPVLTTEKAESIAADWIANDKENTA